MALALVVVASPSRDSFAHAMAAVATSRLRERGYEIAFHDLYDEGFDPVQRASERDNSTSSDALVELHCSELGRADLILVFHPNWWGQPPAVLKGWIDRVFRLGTAYAYPEGAGPEGVPTGLLRARHALIFNTSNTPADREREVFGDPLEALWKACVFGLCGVSSVIRRMYGPMAASSSQQRELWLTEVRTLVENAA
jgi:NAD(P)H dehydrogenase (quinone)